MSAQAIVPISNHLKNPSRRNYSQGNELRIWRKLQGAYLRRRVCCVRILTCLGLLGAQDGRARRPGAPAGRHPRGSPLPRRDRPVGRFRVRRAFLDGDRDGLFIFFVGVILFCVAAAVDFLTHLLVAAAPVVMLASGMTISCVTPYASRRGVGQWGGAGGASCEDHFALAGRL